MNDIEQELRVLFCRGLVHSHGIFFRTLQLCGEHRSLAEDSLTTPRRLRQAGTDYAEAASSGGHFSPGIFIEGPMALFVCQLTQWLASIFHGALRQYPFEK